MNKLSAVFISSLLATASFASDNSIKVVRTAQSPSVIEVPNVEVTVYKTVSHIETGGPCGYNKVGDQLIPVTCQINERTADHAESVSLRLRFPSGAELTGNQQEKIEGDFYNDEHDLTKNYGTIDLRIKSKAHKYDKKSLKDIRVNYGVWNDITVPLK